MPETDVAPPAESSPAEETPQATPEKQETVSVPTNAEDYAEWRMSGKLPEKKEPSPETSAPSKKPSVTAAPEPASQNKRQGYDSRKEELNREIRDLIAQRDRIKSEVQQPVKQDVNREPESSPAQPAQHEPLGRKRPKEPNQDDFSSWSDYKKAETEYIEKLAEFKAAQLVEEYTQTQAQQARQAAMQQKLDEAKSRYGDDSEPLIHKTGVALFQNSQVHQGVKAAIGRSDVMVDALYVMGSDPQELESFVYLATKDPLEALRKWFTVETLVRSELGRNGKAETNGNSPPRDESGQFVSSKPPARMRHAPAPPTELGGNTSPPGDERDRAAASGDVRKFFNEGNRRDLARWKGQL